MSVLQLDRGLSGELDVSYLGGRDKSEVEGLTKPSSINKIDWLVPHYFTRHIDPHNQKDSNDCPPNARLASKRATRYENSQCCRYCTKELYTQTDAN